MAVLWQDDKLNPETIVKLFERERHAWLEMAATLESMKTALVSGGAVAAATNRVHDCRARAEALKKLTARLCDQFGLPAVSHE